MQRLRRSLNRKTVIASGESARHFSEYPHPDQDKSLGENSESRENKSASCWLPTIKTILVSGHLQTAFTMADHHKRALPIFALVVSRELLPNVRIVRQFDQR